MHKFCIFFFILLASCANVEKTNIFTTDEKYKFDISTHETLQRSFITHFNNFDIDHNADEIIILDINKDKNDIYKSVLENKIHIDFITQNPEEIFNIINIINLNDRELISDCINAFLRYHAVKTF